MAKLSGWTYLIIGVILALVSYLINKKSGESKLFLFFWMGILLAIVGLFKIITKPKQKKEKKTQHPKVIFCPFCGQAVYETQRFCHRCRSRLKSE